MIDSKYNVEWVVKAFTDHKYDELLKYAMPFAQAGVADAQCVIGNLYQCGQGIPTNYTEALKWYRLAADQGHPIAWII